MAARAVRPGSAREAGFAVAVKAHSGFQMLQQLMTKAQARPRGRTIVFGGSWTLPIPKQEAPTL